MTAADRSEEISDPGVRAADRTPDAVARSWVDMLPAGAQPYARLARADRPIGTWLLYWPCAWGLFLIPGNGERAAWFALAFLVGAFVMRSAGCAWNDIVDRELDARVARTRDRPVASGRISVGAAFTFTIFLCLIGLAVLVFLPLPAQLVALASVVLVAAYPFMKRITWWPQAWLGLTFNWGALVGAAAIAEGLPVQAVVLYAAGFFWTLGYDTIYAVQDLEDDALAGIRSSARRLGTHVRTGVVLFYLASAALAALAAGWIQADRAWAALPFALHLGWQAWRLRAIGDADGDAGRTALSIFRSNAAAGLLFAAGLLVTLL
ncbi:4-hydroxybenzoate polyprenyltransferase [Pacificimonas flava]|uniref:4-hydroxybenzoate octaprenyltransferase n=2 Tax=Pacificimonas TaxID=1960290 RepID=A0A219B4A9_9SPHN|nr:MULTISPECIES: 4-hydroxybenzoate octaprenyltransferase [Pacificimonas]MBZ6377028.1 4-hydroxybenzoate octaprenyltransferase [Pacificimonas aurantium]OWV33230.1 4-hydroxybenzoate polyprenyltransferase [Pacificimonas flava]